MQVSFFGCGPSSALYYEHGFKTRERRNGHVCALRVLPMTDEHDVSQTKHGRMCVFMRARVCVCVHVHVCVCMYFLSQVQSNIPPQSWALAVFFNFFNNEK